MLSKCAIARNYAAGPARFFLGPRGPGFVEPPSDVCISRIISLGSIAPAPRAIFKASTCVKFGFLRSASRSTASRSDWTGGFPASSFSAGFIARPAAGTRCACVSGAGRPLRLATELSPTTPEAGWPDLRSRRHSPERLAARPPGERATRETQVRHEWRRPAVLNSLRQSSGAARPMPTNCRSHHSRGLISRRIPLVASIPVATKVPASNARQSEAKALHVSKLNSFSRQISLNVPTNVR